MKNDDAALSELSPRSGSATSPPRRERWLGRSILLGVNRAAGLATAALHVGAFIVWLRSPLSMAMGSMRIYAITTIIAITLCAWLLRPKRLRTSNYFFSTTLLLFIATFILNQNVRSEVVSFTSSSSTVPSVAGWLLAGWMGVVITAVSCMLLQARDKRELL